jgi:hypothetical protein
MCSFTSTSLVEADRVLRFNTFTMKFPEKILLALFYFVLVCTSVLGHDGL